MFKKKFLYIFVSIIAVCCVGISTLMVLDATNVIHILRSDLANVQFRNYDDSFLWETKVEPGKGVEYEGPAPTKENEGPFEYVFSNWDTDITCISDDCVVHAQFVKQPTKYNVTFVNYDYSELYVDKVFYGNTANYIGPVPTRPNDGNTKYIFSGWDKPLENIIEDTTIMALYETVDLDFVVTFKNYDETILAVTSVESGGTAVYDGMTPIKPGDEQYDYVFIGWDHYLDNVDCDFSTTAIFDGVPVQYTASFYNYDGSLLYEDKVAYGGTAEYVGVTPYKPSDEYGDYIFEGWNKDLTNITNDASFIAMFRLKNKEHVVRFFNYDDVLLQTSVVTSGENANYDGPTPERPDDEKYTYTFAGWDRSLVSIHEDIDAYALYDKQLRTFVCEFVNFDYYPLYTCTVTYGETAVYFGETPHRQSDILSNWRFIGWDKELTNITKDTVFVAQYEYYEQGGGGHGDMPLVCFYDYVGNTLLDADIVNKGEEAFYRGKQMPFRERFNYRDFYFQDWDKQEEMKCVYESMDVYPQFTTSYGEIIATYRNPFGEIIYEEFLYSGESSSYQGEYYDYLLPSKGFIGWSRRQDSLTRSTTFFPVYKEGI